MLSQHHLRLRKNQKTRMQILEDSVPPIHHARIHIPWKWSSVHFQRRFLVDHRRRRDKRSYRDKQPFWKTKELMRKVTSCKASCAIFLEMTRVNEHGFDFSVFYMNMELTSHHSLSNTMSDREDGKWMEKAAVNKSRIRNVCGAVLSFAS